MALFCSKCGKELDENAAFCKHCGAQVSKSEGDRSTPARGGKKVGKVRIIISLVAAVAVVFIVYAFLEASNNRPNLRAGSSVPREQVLLNEVVSVQAHTERHYSFTLNRGALLRGDFRAFGGTGNDIIVLVMNADSYVNWSNGHKVNPLYDSGQVTVGNISVNLSPGTYYVVFDNSFSVVTNKSVEAHLKLVVG